ncbi:ABC transporter permease [Rhodanobacter sp. IGA1.0]|uniref:Transport permease protein n=1 Tax=Rhodanobacter sp. IGA1.0 TaxID=3158582 RepID=A0AAU7QIQ7_9GAMM
MIMINRYRLADPLSPYRALVRHFNLIMQLARRDVSDRYRGSLMGLFWSFVNPLVMLLIYTFVFGVIFKARWSAQLGGHFAFALVLFSGLNINSLFAECANRAPTLIISNTNFVKKVVFPLEILSWSVVGAALFHLLISTIALLVIAIFVNGFIPWTVVFLPVIVAVFLPFVAGTVWLLASFGVFLRDLKQAIGIITTALMFLAPILYPKELVPPQYRDLLYLNPLTVIVEASQDVLIWGKPPMWSYLALYALASGLFAWASFVWFQRTRKGFADVL